MFSIQNKFEEGLLCPDPGLWPGQLAKYSAPRQRGLELHALLAPEPDQIITGKRIFFPTRNYRETIVQNIRFFSQLI